MSETEPKPFLSRWAKRKAARQSGAAEPDQADQLDQPDESAAATDQTDEEAALSDAELCARYDLPDPESCTEEDQLDGFFSGRVPDRLRQLAMRRMWRLNPLFRFADEMVEYGEDFTDAATVIPDMQTAYKVGKGYLDKLLAEEKEAEAEQAAEQLAADDLMTEEPAAEQLAQSSEEPAEADQQTEPEEAEQTARTDPRPDRASPPVSGSAAEETAPVLAAADDTEAAAPVIRPRRMVFTKNQT